MQKKLVKHIFENIKSPINFGGLKIIKQFDYYQNKIIFFVNNPKNLSHSREAVLSFIEDDIVRGYTTLFDTVISHRDFLSKFVEVHFDNLETENKRIALYINEQDYDKYFELANFVTKIELKKLKLVTDARVKLRRIYVADSEGVTCECYIMFSNTFLDGKLIDVQEVKDLVNSDRFWDHFEDVRYQLLDKLISEIWVNDLIIDKNFMYCVPDFIFKFQGEILN